MKYIIPAALMAASAYGIAKVENGTVDFLLALLFCVSGYFLVKSIAQYFSIKKRSS